MDVDIRLLRYFAAVADEGNLTRAAQRLFVSQPALTKQIRHLEAQLGVTLFTRSRAGVSTAIGGRGAASQVAWRSPDSTVASPHLFQKVAMPGICVDR